MKWRWDFEITGEDVCQETRCCDEFNFGNSMSYRVRGEDDEVLSLAVVDLPKFLTYGVNIYWDTIYTISHPTFSILQ